MFLYNLALASNEGNQVQLGNYGTKDGNIVDGSELARRFDDDVNSTSFQKTLCRALDNLDASDEFGPHLKETIFNKINVSALKEIAPYEKALVYYFAFPDNNCVPTNYYSDVRDVYDDITAKVKKDNYNVADDLSSMQDANAKNAILKYSIYKNDIKLAKEILKQDPLLSQDWLLFHKNVVMDIEILDILKNNGVNFNAKNSKGETPLDIAIAEKFNDYKIVDQLVENLVDMGADKFNYSIPSLNMMGRIAQNNENVKEVFNKKNDMNILSAVKIACDNFEYKDYPELYNNLLLNSDYPYLANLSSLDGILTGLNSAQKKHLFHNAADMINFSMMKVLVDDNPKIVNAVNLATGGSALHQGNVQSYPKISELLLENGINPNIVDKKGDTVLDQILKRQNFYDVSINLTEKLITKGGEVNSLEIDEEEFEILLVDAVKNSMPNTVEFLFSKCTSYDSQFMSYLTNKSIELGNYKTADFLLSKGTHDIDMIEMTKLYLTKPDDRTRLGEFLSNKGKCELLNVMENYIDAYKNGEELSNLEDKIRDDYGIIFSSKLKTGIDFNKDGIISECEINTSIEMEEYLLLPLSIKEAPNYKYKDLNEAIECLENCEMEFIGESDDRNGIYFKPNNLVVADIDMKAVFDITPQ